MVVEREGPLAHGCEWRDVQRLVIHIARCRRRTDTQPADHADMVQDALLLAWRRYSLVIHHGAGRSVPACMIARHALGDAARGRGFRLGGDRRRLILTGRRDLDDDAIHSRVCAARLRVPARPLSIWASCLNGDHQRLAVALLLGMKVAEIAEDMGIARSRASALRAELRSSLLAYLG
jgi:DNA-directed RNA polymerase specialized sigma24 family protein